MTAMNKKEVATAAPDKEFPPAVDYNEMLVAELREDPVYAETYLQAALAEIYEPGGVAAFLTALRRVIEARGGVGEIAKKSGLGRQNIYRALSENGNPTIKTLTEITRAAGVRLVPHS